MRRTPAFLILSATVALLCNPVAARADGYVSPFVGVNFANNSGNGRANVGVAAGWMGAGIAGAEVDVGYAPNFFGSQGSFGNNSVLTLMGNLIVGIPGGSSRGAGLRPYGTIGVGLMRSDVNGQPAPGFVPSIADNNVGLNGGLGLMGFLSEHVGIRGDVRYFHDFRESPPKTVQFGSFHFWRGTLGVILRP